MTIPTPDVDDVPSGGEVVDPFDSSGPGGESSVGELFGSTIS